MHALNFYIRASKFYLRTEMFYKRAPKFYLWKENLFEGEEMNYMQGKKFYIFFYFLYISWSFNYMYAGLFFVQTDHHRHSGQLVCKYLGLLYAQVRFLDSHLSFKTLPFSTGVNCLLTFSMYVFFSGCYNFPNYWTRPSAMLSYQLWHISGIISDVLIAGSLLWLVTTKFHWFSRHMLTWVSFKKQRNRA